MNSRKMVQSFNGRVEWNIGGAGYFKLLSSATPVDVELYDAERQALDAPDAEGGYYQRIKFSRVVITTPSDQEVAWLYAPDEGGSDRLAGNVTVDPAERSGNLATDANRAFIGAGLQAAGGAGLVPHVQVKNPAASGKTVYVDALHFYSASAIATAISISFHDADLTTLVGTLASKLRGGAASSAQIRTQNNNPRLGTEIMMHNLLVANMPLQTVKFCNPIRLNAGTGLLVSGNAGNLTLLATYEIREY